MTTLDPPAHAAVSEKFSLKESALGFDINLIAAPAAGS
jgi:hypothetical protein